MRLADTRPPFVGLAKLSDEALTSLPTPCYLLDEGQLRRNGEILFGVQQRTGCKILLAQKAFSNFDVYPVLAPYLAGTEASGLYESRLGREELPEKENHVFCAAYRADEFAELLHYADHIVFNSPRQLAKFGPAAKAAGKSVGLRVNPECSTQEGHAIYDPCAPGSRLGTTRAQWDAAVAAHPELPELLDGLHFHTLCEQDADALAVTLKAVEATFGDLLPKMKWVNFGGGHHVTRPGYDLATRATSAPPCWTPCRMETPALPFWICRRPATPRMLSRCPTARPCWTPETPAKSPAPCGWGAPPAWQGM